MKLYMVWKNTQKKKEKEIKVGLTQTTGLVQMENLNLGQKKKKDQPIKNGRVST